jgi:hypothetical protein
MKPSLVVMLAAAMPLLAACGGSSPPEDEFLIANDYHTYDEIGWILDELATRHSDVCRLEQVGTSVQGRVLWALKISDNVDADEEEPVVYIEGGIHGSEWLATEVSLRIAAHLCQGYSTDPEVAGRVDELEIWVIPLANPDGHVRVEGKEFIHAEIVKGRKNAAELDGTDCVGVNLNRNFDYHWQEGGSTDPCDHQYRGPAPFSEPEAQALRDLCLANPPAIALHYHTWGELIHFSHATGDAGFEEEMLGLSEAMHDAIHAVNEHYYIIMGVTHYGLAAGWVSGTFGVPAFTMELRPGPINGEEEGGHALPRREIYPTFQENLAGALVALDYAISGTY